MLTVERLEEQSKQEQQTVGVVGNPHGAGGPQASKRLSENQVVCCSGASPRASDQRPREVLRGPSTAAAAAATRAPAETGWWLHPAAQHWPHPPTLHPQSGSYTFKTLYSFQDYFLDFPLKTKQHPGFVLFFVFFF